MAYLAPGPIGTHQRLSPLDRLRIKAYPCPIPKGLKDLRYLSAPKRPMYIGCALAG